jgi:hypothetical protein
MAKAHLLHVACTVAMFAASPVFAQNNAQTGDAAGAANTPASHDAMPSSTAPMSTAPAGSEQPTHKMAMEKHHHGGAMHSSKGDSSQDAMVDRLNEQSFQAAQQGQSFSGSGAGTAMPSGAGMHDMSGSGATGGGKM